MGSWYNYMYLKSPKCSKRFSSSLARDVVIAFRISCFPSEKKAQINGLYYEMGPQSLPYFLI